MSTNIATIKLSVIEPWDFDPPEFTATVEGIDVDRNSAEVRVSQRCTYKGISCTAFRMTPRKKEIRVERLLSGDSVDFNLILIDDQEIGLSKEDFYSGWVNNIGLLATVKRV